MKKYFLLTLSLGLVLGVNIYFRTFPINLPQLKSEAINKVEDKIHQDIIKEIDKKFPGFNNLAKNRLIANSISKYKKNNKQAIKSEIQREYLESKDRYQDASGQTYLLELDCWHWARYTDNVYRLGHPGDEVINGKQIDTLMLAPSGSQIPWNQFLFYLSAWLYRVFSIIKHTSLFTFLFYLPLFFTTVFLTVLYLLCFYRWGNLCAAIACFFVGLFPLFVMRSCAGWFDTDIFNLFFPLLICWSYAKAYDTRSLKSRVLWLCFSGFWLGLFCFTWVYWWFILLVVVIYEIYSLATSALYYYLRKDGNPILLKKHLSSLLLFLAFGFFWIIFYSGLDPLKMLCSQVKGALVLNSPLTVSIWPNVLSTVGELKKIDLVGMVDFIGKLPFVLSFCCMSMLFLRTLYKPKFVGFEREYITILFFWFTSMCFASFRGVRFVVFLLIPLGISLGWVISEVYHYFKKKKIWIAFAILIAMVFLGVESLDRASATAKDIFPMMEDAWHKTLIAIAQKTPKDTVIDAWWDMGDWFKAVSKRRVIFDGQSSYLPQSYWMANVFLTNNEKEAIRTLRMLNNGGNKAFEIINQYLKEPFFSVLLLKSIIVSEPKKAKEALLRFLPAKETEEVLRLVFNNPGNAYFVVDYGMARVIDSLSFLGNWNFVKLYLIQNLNKKEETKTKNHLIKLGIDRQQIEKFYQEAKLISPEKLYHWVSDRVQIHGKLVKGEEKGSVILFDNGMVYSPKEKAVYLYSSEDGRYKIPTSLFLFNENKMEEVGYPNEDLDYSVLIFKSSGGYRAILLDRELANSMFVRLYFLRGAGLAHFKPFIEEKDGEDYIRVFEIIWGEK